MNWMHEIPSPVGPILAAVSKAGELVYLGFKAHEPRQRLLARLEASRSCLTEDPRLLVPLQDQLGEYFAGRRQRFDLPLDLQGTPFQLRVWEALQSIPYGHTLSYGALAARLGDPKLSRAVGTANGANPVSIVVPCHRVIGGNGALTGYAGGLELKRALLEREGSLPVPLLR